MNLDYYSHIREGKKEYLIDHLNEVSFLAEQYASAFGAQKIAAQIGCLHDIGKHTIKFQDVLSGKRSHIDHAVPGAEIYWNKSSYGEAQITDCPEIAQIICNCIMSHHSELHGSLKDNAIDDESKYCAYPDNFIPDCLITENGKENAFSNREEIKGAESYTYDNRLITEITEIDHPNMSEMTSEALMLYERMLYSCLVDADYSATAAFYDNADYRLYSRRNDIDANNCLKMLASYRCKRRYGSDSAGLNGLRNKVYSICANAGSSLPAGLYTLTAPTGTGKTHALIRFALEQAKRNGQKKIFVVLPYLSIIEQNTNEYKMIFGNDNCIECDSNSDIPESLRLSAERWDYPIIVTTSVSFFETLCGAKASKERKLHSIADAVIVFDESQTLPSEYLDVTMDTLSALPKYFNTTVLLSTATQPDYRFRKKLKDLNIKEIIDDVPELYKQYAEIRKLDVTADINKKLSYERLVAYYDLMQQLFVFNTTSKAVKMFDVLCDRYGQGNCFFLSSRLCPAHKKEIIDEIRKRLKEGLPCFVASTQCIEAGVDFSFPAGMREYAPLPSVVQTAGRVNRNAEGIGKFHIFILDEDGKFGYPNDTYRNESYITEDIAKRAGSIDTNDLEQISEYYKQIYAGDAEENADKKEIVQAVDNKNTKALADNYRLIEDDGQISVIVPYSGKKFLYNDVLEQLSVNSYCMNKTVMKRCSDITVRLYKNKKIKEHLVRHCQVLYMRSHEIGDLVPTDWYIVVDPDVYDDKKGFITEETEGGIFF